MIFNLFKKKSLEEKLFSKFGSVEVAYSPLITSYGGYYYGEVDSETYPFIFGNIFNVVGYDVMNICYEDYRYILDIKKHKEVRFLLVNCGDYKFALMVDDRVKESMYRYINGTYYISLEKKSSLNKEYTAFLMSLV